MKNLPCLISLLLAVASCASHKDVRPGADGIHRVVVRASSRAVAERRAIKQANHYCDEEEKHAAFLAEETNYTGSMDEKTRNTLRQASTAAMVLGGAGAATGKSETMKSVGGAVGAAGTAGRVMVSGNDYTADMKFKCR